MSIWGASRISRNRAKILEEHGIAVQNYIDITTKRQLDKEVIHYRDLPTERNIFILVYLKQETMRLETTQFLNELGYQEGKHYLLVS